MNEMHPSVDQDSLTEKQMEELAQDRSILDLEREVIYSLTSGHQDEDEQVQQQQEEGSDKKLEDGSAVAVESEEDFGSPNLDYVLPRRASSASVSTLAAAQRHSAEAARLSSRQPLSFHPDDTRATNSDTFTNITAPSATTLRRISSTTALPSYSNNLRAIGGGVARTSAPPTEWNPTMSAPARRSVRNAENSSTIPVVRSSLLASFRNFLSSDAPIEVTPHFPHMFRSSRNLDDLNWDEDMSRFRLVKRNLPNFQSMNQVAIDKRSKLKLQRTQSSPSHINTYLQRYVYQYVPSEWLPTLWALYLRDWFHILLRWPTPLSILFWSVVWTCSILLFALVYLAASRPSNNNICYLANGFIFDFTAAFSFSLLTSTTVGYTLPGGTNAFFEKCPGIQTAVFAQVVFSLIFNAFLVTFLYTRISRAETRSTQVLFGNKALLRPIVYEDSKGRKITRWTMEIRVFDADAAHPICEAHVRIYASILGESQHLQVCRLLRPDDSQNGFLFTSVPYSIIHEIDFFSPLTPSNARKLQKEHGQWLIGWNGLERRESDARNQTSYGWICPVCATTCGEMGRLIQHIKYMKLQDKFSNVPKEHSHERISDKLLDLSLEYGLESLDVTSLKRHLENIEIICVVEGIDPITSGTFQALQSYTIDDLVFGGSFMPCVRLDKDEIVVDLDKFHRIARPGYLVHSQIKGR